MHKDRKIEKLSMKTFEELHPTYVAVKPVAQIPKDELEAMIAAEAPQPKLADRPLWKVKSTDKAKEAHNEQILTACRRLATRVKTAPGFFAGERGEKVKRRIVNKSTSLLT